MICWSCIGLKRPPDLKLSVKFDTLHELRTGAPVKFESEEPGAPASIPVIGRVEAIQQVGNAWLVELRIAGLNRPLMRESTVFAIDWSYSTSARPSFVVATTFSGLGPTTELDGSAIVEGQSPPAYAFLKFHVRTLMPILRQFDDSLHDWSKFVQSPEFEFGIREIASLAGNIVGYMATQRAPVVAAVRRVAIQALTDAGVAALRQGDRNSADRLDWAKKGLEYAMSVGADKVLSARDR
jgi:hypothetical protein